MKNLLKRAAQAVGSYAKREPVRFFAGVQAIGVSVGAVVSEFTAFDPTEAQRLALVGLYVASTGLVIEVIRDRVTPV